MRGKIKRGNILKGKVYSLKIIISLLIIFAAGFCFGVGNLPKSKQMVDAASTKVVLGETGEEQEFSALFEGDVIFSVEKVLIDSKSATPGLQDEVGDNIHTFIGEYNEKSLKNEKYVFQDLAKDKTNKTVVDNGEFVKFENIYENEQYSIRGSSSLQEAIIISFGSYVYNSQTGRVEIAVDDEDPADQYDTAIYAGITYLDIVIKKDGTKLDIPSVRNITTPSGPNLDFVHCITQGESNEGFYTIEVKYMVKNRQYSSNFEFSLVNNTSYTQNVNPTEKDFGYNAAPTLGWVNKSEFSQTSEDYNRYYIGETGINANEISYPTFTYDYTKYKVSYQHTANQRNTKHELIANVGKTASLTWNSISSEGNTSKTYELYDYDKTSSINLVTLMFTEPGSYVFTYEYLHNGEVVSDFGFEPGEIKLAIYGMSTYYSKANFEGAKMQYFEISTTRANSVDLIIPNGYELNEDISSLQNKKIGFVYSIVEDNTNGVREGNVLTSNSKDALINKELKLQKSNTYAEGIDTDFEFLTINDAENTLDFTNADALDNILKTIKYQTTNQGSLWLEGNDVYTENSFYFYNEKEITNESTKEEFTNITSFNKKGYYLVFLQVDPSGVSDNSDTYWQIFAFQYTSSAVDINVEAINTNNTEDVADDTYELVAGGKFTNKNVRISWKKPKIFDRAVYGYIYSAINQNYDKEQMLSTAKKSLTTTEMLINGETCYVANLGSDVQQNTFVKYLIRIESEGESATHKMFTIDRQSISGVQPYLVKEMYSGNSIYYTFATDKNNLIVPINNSITNSLATLIWNEKDSGAQISASYIYTPFSVTSKNNVSSITGNFSSEWILTNYELGTTIVGTELKKSNSIYNVESDCILFNQGIYIITLTDDAGNVCRYAFIIDRTENHYKIQDKYLSNTSVIYGDDVNFSVGDYKAFKLDLQTTNETLKEFVEQATAGTLNQFDNYYAGLNNNLNVINKYFQKLGNDYYFTVQNKKVVSYQGEREEQFGVRGELTYIVQNGEGSCIRTIYTIAENQTYSTADIKKGSYVVVEINKDNARGMAYYSDADITAVPLNGLSNNNVKRLNVGSDGLDDQGRDTNGLNGAQATSAKNVAFVWNKGTGNFEVAHVYYEFYSLKPTTYNNDKYYFYGSPEPVDLYKNGKWSNNASEMTDGSGRGFVNFNGSSLSKAGLYVVTRVYKEIAGADLGDDSLEKNYYFIVDRNGIIDTGVGGSIRIELMEEVEFNNFTAQNPDSEIFSNVEDDVENARYNIYLTTTKLPATLNIPMGKYFASMNSSAGYSAGKLNVSVYFNDKIYRQLSGQFKGATVKIYGSTIDSVGVDGCFDIDIYKYLSNVNTELRDRISMSEAGQGSWLFLPGDYIVRITDNVVDSKGENHSLYIGFRVTGKEDRGPKVDAFTGYDDNNMTKVTVTEKGMVGNNHFEYSATVSQEYLKVVLPAYQNNVVNKAQVDPNYVVVKQYYGEKAIAENYINHPYKAEDGITFGDELYSDYVTINADNSINLWLDTKLKTNGEIDLQNLNVPLIYTITVRYKIGTTGQFERYKNCYVYYNNDVKSSYFEATYTIEIDRIAPTQNIEMLNNNDALVNEYNQWFETDSMTENNYHKTSSNIYFTHQYAKYYQANKENKGYIYPYQVNEETVFNTKDASGKLDVVKVLYKQISAESLMDLKSYNLTLPVVDESSYRTYTSTVNLKKYSGLSLIANNYYEIIEIDAAGNLTQYVVHYRPQRDVSNPEIVLPTQITTTSGNSEEKNLVLDYESEDLSAVNIYNISSKGKVEHDFENFFKVEILRIDGSTVFKTLTTATTDFDNLTEEVVSAINAEKFGNFVFKITTRTHTSSTQINLYDQNDVQALDVKDLVVEANPYQIVLGRANKFDSSKNLWYFATKIEIKTATNEETYLGLIDEQSGEVKYIKEGVVFSDVECLSNTTYHITMTDVLGTVSNYRFNSSGQEFVVLEFVDVENDAEKDYYQGNEGTNVVYYGFTDATLKYDKTIYTSRIWKKANNGTYQDATLTIVEDKICDDVYNIIYIDAIYDETLGIGGLVEVKVDLYFEGKLETTYFITIDTRLSNVALRDYSTGEQRDIIKIFANADFDAPNVGSDKTGSGVMNLHWTEIEENSYFDYEFILHELMDDETYRHFNLNDKLNHSISTEKESSGIYKFEIKVFGKDGTYLGNRVYAFEVQEVSTQVYYVRNKATGEAINSNAEFKVKNLGTLADIITDDPDCKDINDSIDLPLFINHHELEVVVTKANVDKKEVPFINNDEYSFTIYRISKENGYSLFIGVLIIKSTATSSNLVESVSIVANTTETIKNKTMFTVAGEKTDDVSIQVNKKQKVDAYGLLAKNLLLIDVYYMNEFVSTEVLTSANPLVGIYNIRGNGEYSFVIKDLAGNIHEFEEDEDKKNTETVDKINIYVLREVVVTINNQAIIENAFYNDKVELAIYSSMKYVTGSIKLVAERNGEPYTPSGYNPYVFTDYGTYRVIITANYNSLAEPLRKVVTFTILNAKEARQSIDFTSLSGCKITKVLNPIGQDVTDAFNDMLANSLVSGGMNISYDDIMEYSSMLNVTSGKITFTLTYQMNDGIYPTRETTILFTMNNEVPIIHSTLKKGDSTTKGFDVYFNPLIIYEQVGEAYVYINDRLIAHITEGSPNEELRVNTNFKEFGDGDYYVKLVSSSGVVLDSYKLTIKEPLNTWAIIVIIVVVGVVVTVAVTIIVLRRKMRIR